MKKIISVSCLVVVCALLVTGAFNSAPVVSAQNPQVFTHSQAGLQFTLPSGWKAEPDEAIITVGPADDSVQMMFWVPEQETFDDTIKELDKELGKTLKNVKVTEKGKSDTHNGMPHFSESGSAEVDGVTIAWSVDVLAAKKPVIILTFAAPQFIEQHSSALVKLIESIKKVD